MQKARKPNRLIGYDYSRNALYFITTCVQDRVCCFGMIENERMVLYEYGKIAEQQWFWLQRQYPFVVLHSMAVMPNHIHGIIEIDDAIIGVGVGTGHVVATGRDLSLRNVRNVRDERRERPTIKIKSLSELMGAYKTTTSKQIHLAGRRDFKWQRSFHDYIIRNEHSYLHISDYIQNNPLNWKEDLFYR
jgi:putative transposase